MSGLSTDHDLYLFNEGTHLHLADKLGAHPGVFEGVASYGFTARVDIQELSSDD